MMRILEIFFQTLPRMLFEPVAVGALLGIAAALFFCWKKKTVWYWMILCAVLFMLAWRLAIQIISSRYAAVLLFPAVIFTAFFCFKLEDVLKYIFRFVPKFRYADLTARIVPWLFVLGLSIAGFVKVMHVNFYSGYLEKTCGLYHADRAGKEESCRVYTLEGKEYNRILYYADLKEPNADMIIAIAEGQDPVKILRSRLRSLRNVKEVCYFFAAHRNGEPEFTAEALGLKAEQWVKLGGYHTSKRKNKTFVLYKYIPAAGK